MWAWKFNAFIKVKNAGDHYQQAAHHICVGIKNIGSLDKEQIEQGAYRKDDNGIAQCLDDLWCGQEGAEQKEEIRKVQRDIAIIKLQVIHIMEAIPPGNDFDRYSGHYVNNERVQVTGRLFLQFGQECNNKA